MRRAALRSQGLTVSEKAVLQSLHRYVVMTRAGAAMFPRESGSGVSWRGRCQKCDRERWLQVSHIYPVGRYPGMRYDSDNAFAFCWGCHFSWWHKHTIEATEWARTHHGERCRTLYMRSQLNARTKIDFVTTKLFLEQEVRR